MISQVHFTVEAIQRITPDQRDKIAHLARREGEVEDINVFADFSLPDTYVGVEIKYKDGHSIYGGIDPKGEMST